MMVTSWQLRPFESDDSKHVVLFGQISWCIYMRVAVYEGAELNIVFNN